MVYFGEQMGTGVTLLTCSKGRDQGTRGVEDKKKRERTMMSGGVTRLSSHYPSLRLTFSRARSNLAGPDKLRALNRLC